MGTTIEWYDLYLYSSASALIIGPVFFPSGSSLTGQLAVFGTFAAGFVARPLGGLFFGHLGDRKGRKSALVATMLLMGLATFAIGLLPDYRQAGALAPILLVALRVLQGIGIGGEWGGAVLLATENAPPGRQTLYSSWSAAGFPLGLLASTSVFSFVDYIGTDGQPSWQWRLPFLSSLFLVGVGLFVRLRIKETPSFTEGGRHVARVPALEALRSRPLPILTGALVALGTGLIVTTFSVYLVAWAARQGPAPGQSALHGLMIGAALECLLIPAWAALADRIGPHLVIFTGFVICAAAIVPAAGALSSGRLMDSALLFATALGVGHAAVYGSLAGLLTRLFPSRHRYSGLALTYQMGSTVASAGPLVATALVGDAQSIQPVVTLFLVVMALAGAAVLITPSAHALAARR
ncbi:MFS transporter [Streptomyces sp. NPDC057555]|uniref:MFS transporter n=1 Tax=Streptomyces sp. NPDC057555 TaxID=3346166 RepID=UPI003695DB89